MVLRVGVEMGLRIKGIYRKSREGVMVYERENFSWGFYYFVTTKKQRKFQIWK
jgi:hypothetical protein